MLGQNSNSVLEMNHGKPLEDVIFFPSGGLIATAGDNFVKIWDVIGGGKMIGSMESHNKTVTSLCVGRIGMDGGEELHQNRILSVAMDGYLKVFDYAKMKVTHSMSFPTPLMSIGFSPYCSTRIIGTSNGTTCAGMRKTKENTGSNLINIRGLGSVAEPQRRALRPSHFRYFHRGKSEKPFEGDYLVMKPKNVKLSEHDKVVKKFMHKDALVSVLTLRNPKDLVVVMVELVARKKLLKCVSTKTVERNWLLLYASILNSTSYKP